MLVYIPAKCAPLCKWILIVQLELSITELSQVKIGAQNLANHLF